MLRHWAQCAIFIILVLAGGFFFSAPEVLAQTSQTAEVAATAGFGEADLMTIIGRVISVFLGLLGVIFLILIIYAGFIWMTAGGDDKKVEKAKRILIQATVGLVITLSAYGISAFIINAITGGTGGNGTGGGSNGGVSVESLSGALGSGPVRDHYPARNQLDVPRNTRLSITFKNAIDPTTVTDATVKIFPAAEGSAAALTGTVINFTDDHKTFVFKPAAYLGSASDKVQYKVHLYSGIKDAGGAKIFASTAKEYEWSFTTSTVLDLTPPTVTMAMPGNAGTYARNIVVQATFSEPIDPSSAAGEAVAGGDFTNISITGASSGVVFGEYQISNSYTSLSFVSNDPCGTNSCGIPISCLPSNDSLEVAVKGATTTIDPPQADLFPYDGVVDMSGNSLDGNHDGTAGDAYTWGFSTTGDLALNGPSILSISPNIAEEDVPLDQPVTLIFDGVLMTSSVSQDTIILSNQEVSTGASHEMWFSTGTSYLTSGDEVVTSSGQIPAKTAVEVNHGTFLESVDGLTYQYGSAVLSGVLNEYQNCYVPGAGPNGAGGDCAVTASAPYCCNGSPSASACALF